VRAIDAVEFIHAAEVDDALYITRISGRTTLNTRERAPVHRRVNRTTCTLPFLLCLGVMSCVRVEPQLRSGATSPAPQAVAAAKVATPPRPASLRARPINRVARSTTVAAPPTPVASSPTHVAAPAAQLCVDEINRYRATLGLRPLVRAPEREACADGQIKDDAQSGHWHGRFGACGESAQNECVASSTSQADMIKGCLRGMWGEGPGGGHYENMKSASATSVWCGFFTKPNGDVWSVQDFR
jgi:hypothetical protein